MNEHRKKDHRGVGPPEKASPQPGTQTVYADVGLSIWVYLVGLFGLVGSSIVLVWLNAGAPGAPWWLGVTVLLGIWPALIAIGWLVGRIVGE